jgi:peptidoglycan/LPS O-acetylase OafA/YrhL
VTTTLRERSAAAGPTERSWFRGDVDGLRALAIVMVVGYHAGLPLFGGGFIGVDVFFVISGFLISRNLLRESETTDRIGLGGFWSRRIRRLVPALALVVTATLVAGALILPRYELEALARQGAAADLYVSNILFAVDAQDYFATDLARSPFLHTWSLGVEEQFYIVWPLVFAAACWSQRRRLAELPGPTRRRILAGVFSVVLAASLALSVWLTRAGSTWAFFGLPSRAWEFAVAGLLAVVPVPAALRGVRTRTGLALAGLGVIAVGAAFIESQTPYPGLWALLPVLGTVLVIVGGETFAGTATENPVSRVLALPPMQWVGRVSYSWYLWHWPAIVLTVAALDDDDVGLKTLAALASLPVAWAAYRFYETPLRFSTLLARSHRRTYAVGAAFTVVVLLVAAAVWSRAPDYDDQTLVGLAPPAGASIDERVAFMVEQQRRRGETACPDVGGIETPDGDEYCEGGDPAGERTVLLLGDSHAGQWRTAFDLVARENGIKLLIRQHSGCPSVRVAKGPGDGSDAARKIESCRHHQEGDLRVVRHLQPDAVVVASSTAFPERIVDDDGTPATEPEQVAHWRAGVEELIDELAATGAEVGWIVDEPQFPHEADRCLTQKQSTEACAVDREVGLDRVGALLDVEREVLRERGITETVDLTPLICDEDRCRMEVDGTLVYTDSHHLTEAFTVEQRSRIESMVRGLLGA